jgi:hypothetical protein
MQKPWHEGSQRAKAGPALASLTSFEKSSIEHEAVHAAATKGGAIQIRGREIQSKGLGEGPGRTQMVEGLLWQISEQMTRRAQVLNYRKKGLTKAQIIRAVWKVEQGPPYEAASAQYEEIVGSLKKYKERI